MSAAFAWSSFARTCASSRRAIIWPAVTVSPSRTVISRIFPFVFGATAESSPSMRPLSATMLAGRFGVAKKIFQIKAAATITPTIIKILAMRERGAFCSSCGAPGSGEGVRCSVFGGAWVIVLFVVSLMAFAVPHFLQVGERKIRYVYSDAFQLV